MDTLHILRIGSALKASSLLFRICTALYANICRPGKWYYEVTLLALPAGAGGAAGGHVLRVGWARGGGGVQQADWGPWSPLPLLCI